MRLLLLVLRCLKKQWSLVSHIKKQVDDAEIGYKAMALSKHLIVGARRKQWVGGCIFGHNHLAEVG